MFLPPYEYLKLKNDTNYLMSSKDTIEDPLMSVQLYRESKVFDSVLQSIYCFHFFTQETFKSVFLPAYDSLKLYHDTNYLMTSEDTVEDPLMGVQFYIKGKGFFNSRCSPSTVFILIARDA